MKFYYFPKKTISIAIAVLVITVGLLYFAFAMMSQDRAMISNNIEKPIYQGNTGQKMVSITVNVDWGEEFIPAMLEEFKKNEARVTFFVTGKWAEKNPELLKQMKTAGHSIQNHGYKHLHFNQLAPEQVQTEVKKAEDIIAGITGEKTKYFASPYGEHNDPLVTAVRKMDYKFIMWSIDTIDWQKPSPDTIVNRVMKRIHNDAIILMHPTDPTVKALPELLKQLRDEKYQMVTIDKIVVDPVGKEAVEN